jgi:serine/arginine repetitive matrix protein 2
MSVEGSADGSFEVLEEEWVNEGDSYAEEGGDGSLENIYGLNGGDDSMEILDDDLAGLRITNPDDTAHSPNHSDVEVGEESSTADFMNTLIEEGLFSPPQMATPAFEDQPDFMAIPDVGSEGMERKQSYLDTPSLGDSVHATPMLEGVVGGRFESFKDEGDLGYSLPPFNEISPLPQPDIPISGDHSMLLNANATQPSIQPSTPAAPTSTRVSHQDGPIQDPFITIQTATKVLTPYAQIDRQKSGIPLGRTSHVERVQAARMLATQSLGLGMPRSPAISRDLVDARSMGEDEGKEVMFDASFEIASEENGAGGIEAKHESREEVVETPRRLPRPPRPEPIGLPSPVASPLKSQEVEEEQKEEIVQNKRVSSR